jgi:hypothetical protein
LVRVPARAAKSDGCATRFTFARCSHNGQLAVDRAHQVIIAQRLTTNGSDQDGLVPLLDATTAALGRTPREVSADAGFCREAHLKALPARGFRGYLAGPGQPRQRRSKRPPPGQARLADGRDGRQAQARRPALALLVAQADGRAGDRSDQAGERLPPVPPARLRQVEAEWALVCTAHNLAKLLAARTA